MKVASSPSRACSVDGCASPLLAQGLCSRHYGRWQRYGDPLGGGPERKPAAEQEVKRCSVSGCAQNATSRGLCPGHYARWRKGSDISTPLTRQNIGKPFSRGDGYVFRVDRKSEMAGKKTGRVLEHREVMSELLGRPLRKNEHVHHKNGNRSDNRPENLELWVHSHPAGQKPEDLVAWAYEIIAIYGEEVKPKLRLVAAQNE